MKIVKRILIGLGILLIVVSIGFVAWTRLARHSAQAVATALITPSTKGEQGWLVFKSDQPGDTGFIFYPGGLVDPAAYAPIAKGLADQGIEAIIVPMPLDLAIFGINTAGGVIAANPDIKHWIIGGHSLGGSMAAEYAARNSNTVQGLVFMAAYPAATTNLANLPLKVISIYGSNDHVAARSTVEDGLKRVPTDSHFIVIEGGNHSQFGDYGLQSGDGSATISPRDQWDQTIKAIVGLAKTLGN